MKLTKFNDIPQFTRSGSYQVDFDPKYLVKWIQEEIDEMNLNLNPVFQRGHVWTEQQQIAYIEYFLKGGKSGNVLYFNCPSWHYRVSEGSYNDYVCIDGLQRITAIQKFVNNEIPVFESYFREYEDEIRCASYTFKVNINDLKTEKEVLQWYVDMNAGGTPHTTEEIDRVRMMIDEI